MDKIAVIIVHYDTVLDTDRCLNSLIKIKTKGFEWRAFVVDNGSKIEYQLPPQVSTKQAFLVRSDTNLGFTGGNNLGFRVAVDEYNPDYFLLLNSDTTVDPDFLVNLYHYLSKSNHEVGAVSPLIYFAPHNEFHQNAYQLDDLGRVIWYAGGVIDWQNLSSFHQGVDEVDRGQFDIESNSKIEYATGCCFLVKRQVLETVGGFNDDYFLYFEDADLSMKMKNGGYEIHLVPESKIWHYNGNSSGGAGSNLQNFYLSRNRLLFFWRHGNWRTKITVLRLTIDFLRSKNKVLRKAGWSFLTKNYGKQLYL